MKARNRITASSDSAERNEGVEHAELESGHVGGFAHFATEGVDFARKLTKAQEYSNKTFDDLFGTWYVHPDRPQGRWKLGVRPEASTPPRANSSLVPATTGKRRDPSIIRRCGIAFHLLVSKRKEAYGRDRPNQRN